MQTKRKPGGLDPSGHMTGLLQNEDCTNFFYFQDIPAGEAGAVTDRYVDVLAGAGVTTLLINTNARRTVYRSHVWEAFWDGYDPAGPDDQPFLCAVPSDQIARWRKLVGNMLELHRQGVDYPERMIGRARHHGIAPWISLRMNDVHFNDNLDHPFHGALWRNSALFRQGDPGYYARALDYAHEAVRNHYRALADETIERYDIDGLELDFLREPYLFSKGCEQAGRSLLTAWLRDLRACVDAAATRRGHGIRLGVRVPSNPETALGLGLDAPAWVEEGLVDLVTVAPRWSTIEFAMPLPKWRQLLGDRVTLAGGLEVLYRPSPDAASRYVTTEEAAGAAAAVRSGGADAVYLFNFFQHGHPAWPVEQYQHMLRTLASRDAVFRCSRRHAVTFRDVLVPGESYTPPLPATGKRLAFELPLGPAPGPDGAVESAVELAPGDCPDAAPPSVVLNDFPGHLQSVAALSDGNRLVVHAFPARALSGREDDMSRLTVEGRETVTIRRVEVSLRSS